LDTAIYRNVLDSLYEGVYFCDRDMRITYWNKGAEAITGYKSSEVLGARCRDGFLGHIDDSGQVVCESRCPLKKVLAEGGLCEDELYAKHKDGHRIPVSLRVVPMLDGDGKIVGAVEVFGDRTWKIAMEQKVQELEKMALLDSLTKLVNRRHLEATLYGRFEELRRYGLVLGMLFIDIDHFKKINDKHGHAVGDKVLRLVSLSLQNGLRPFDLVGRWGGEEFVAIIARLDGQQLLYVANRLRMLVEQSRLEVAGGHIEVTVSIGATIAMTDDSPESLVRRADELMYRAKKLGRNQVQSDIKGSV
jgi:diguanylate cyclase (GGDEF)-like protein/PAS domain S-box-containing protein